MEISKLHLFMTIVWSDRKFKNNFIFFTLKLLVLSLQFYDRSSDMCIELKSVFAI